MKRPQSAAPLRFSWLDFKVGLRMWARYPAITLVGTVAIAGPLQRTQSAFRSA
jgi:hypothetical protein